MNENFEKTSADKVNDAMTVTALAIALVGTAFIIQDFGKSVTRKLKELKNRNH